MRLFRRKSDSPSGHQEYLSDLITSIRKAKREEIEQQDEKPDLHSFIEDDYFPGGKPGPAKVPPGVAKDGSPVAAGGEEADAVADLEAYLSALNAAEEAAAETVAEDDEPV